MDVSAPFGLRYFGPADHWRQHLCRVFCVVVAGWLHAMGMAGLILLVASVFVIDEFHPFPGWWALMPITGSVLAMAAGEHSWANRNILSWRPAVLIGLISYPLYLWHWPILSFM